jgi:exodeoxyribonuclease VII large subunit
MPDNFTINTIITIIQSSISTVMPPIICMTINVIDIREYKGMLFLKVGDDTGSINAIVYRSNIDDEICKDDRLETKCRVDLYNGSIQLNIQSYQKIGNHHTRFALLKIKLEALGYFNNKPDIKSDYSRIGIISSLQAAGLRDFIYTIQNRCHNKKILVYPASVQGKHAEEEIKIAIKLANTHNKVDIIVLIRGGGSKEDLECFNSEIIATSIYDSKIPVVTGIGHQIDTSITDLVAAKSFITPTAVAQNITLENTGLNNSLILIRTKIHRLIGEYYQYVMDNQTILSEMKNNWTHQNETMISYYQNNQLKLINIIMDSVRNTYQYVRDTEENLSVIMDDYKKQEDRVIQQYDIIISTNFAKCGDKLNKYQEILESISKPKLIDRNGHEISMSKDIQIGKTYQLCFVDGKVDINF